MPTIWHPTINYASSTSNDTTYLYGYGRAEHMPNWSNTQYANEYTGEWIDIYGTFQLNDSLQTFQIETYWGNQKYYARVQSANMYIHYGPVELCSLNSTDYWINPSQIIWYRNHTTNGYTQGSRDFYNNRENHEWWLNTISNYITNTLNGTYIQFDTRNGIAFPKPIIGSYQSSNGMIYFYKTYFKLTSHSDTSNVVNYETSRKLGVLLEILIINILYNNVIFARFIVYYVTSSQH